MAQAVSIRMDGGAQISGLLDAPEQAETAFVFAHGAGAGMTHAFMEAAALGLTARRVAVLRFNFPCMEAGGKRPDPPALAQAAVRAATAEAGRLLPSLPLFAGGKSFGGRITSQAQAAAPLPGLRGLVFFGFPLHPAGKPGLSRAAHLESVNLPLLFLQGTKDKLAAWSLIEPLVRRLPETTLFPLAEADHGFHVPARSGRKDAEILAEMLDAAASWMIARGA